MRICSIRGSNLLKNFARNRMENCATKLIRANGVFDSEDESCEKKKFWAGAVALAKQVNSFMVSPDSSITTCKRFFVAGRHVGYIRPDIWRELQNYSDIFLENGDSEIHLSHNLKTWQERSEKIRVVLEELRAKNVFRTLRGWRNETYDVAEYFGRELLLRMERSACCLFGVKQYGVHINGYVRGNSPEFSCWVGRRSKTKQTWPDRYDSLAAGGLSSGLRPRDCALKEAFEEANIPEELLKGLRPAGTVSFIYEDDRGVFPEVQFVYDLPLPDNFVPTNNDGEVASFELMNEHRLRELCVTSAFKPNSGLVQLDFLIRHGRITPDEDPQYLYLTQACHTPVG